jgi:hypothetical protein
MQIKLAITHGPSLWRTSVVPPLMDAAAAYQNLLISDAVRQAK